MNKIDMYLNEMYIQEDIQSFVKEFSKFDKSFINKMKNAVDLKNPAGTIKKISKMAPPGLVNKKPVQKIDRTLTSALPEYPKWKKRATAVIKNSVSGVSDQLADAAGTFVVFSSMFAKKGQENIAIDQNIKNNLKMFVGKTRHFADEYENEPEKRKIRPSDYADISVAWIIIAMSTALAVGVGGGAFVFLKTIAVAISAGVPSMIAGGLGLLKLFVYGILGGLAIWVAATFAPK